VVALRLSHGLDDVPGWGILAALCVVSMGATERSRLVETLVSRWCSSAQRKDR
jgi:hypothetical protein